MTPQVVLLPIIGSVQFGADGSVAIEYSDPTVDNRAGASRHHTLVLTLDERSDELVELERLFQRALVDALERFDELEVAGTSDDDDDELRPYDHPDYSSPGSKGP